MIWYPYSYLIHDCINVRSPLSLPLPPNCPLPPFSLNLCEISALGLLSSPPPPNPRNYTMGLWSHCAIYTFSGIRQIITLQKL
jgi:hypothetical protein